MHHMLLRSLLEDLNQLHEAGCTFCYRPSTKPAPPASSAHQFASAGNALFNMVVDTDTTATKVLRYLNQGRRGQLTCCKLLPCWICSCGSVLHLAPAFSLYTAGLRAL